jgi:hypothetical protein
MKTERWQQISHLYDAALACDGGQRIVVRGRGPALLSGSSCIWVKPAVLDSPDFGEPVEKRNSTRRLYLLRVLLMTQLR